MRFACEHRPSRAETVRLSDAHPGHYRRLMFTIREATQRDTATLLDALHAAANWDGTDRKSRNELRSSKYIAEWKRPEDFGVVAVGTNDRGIGAAWFRFLPEDDPGYGFVTESIPELTIGVAEPARGVGVGHALLAALLDMADERECEATSLSVEDGNTARRLYERAGFAVVGRNGGSDTLLRPRVVR